MFPPQTSLIPVTVAVIRFLEAKGFSAYSQIYPFWYLGLPFKFLTGPVVVIIAGLVHKTLPVVSLFSIVMYLIILSSVLAAVGWGLLAKKISGRKNFGILVGILVLVLPWRYLTALAVEEGAFAIARNILPWVLTIFWNYLETKTLKKGIAAALAVAFLLLIHTNILPSLIVGTAALVLAAGFKDGKFKRIWSLSKQILLIVLAGLVLATFWYTPAYWLTLLFNPSIGGASLARVVLKLFDLFRTSLPVILALASLYFLPRVKSRLVIFALAWTGGFAFLTFFRYLGNIRFWLDWTSWFGEIEIGGAFWVSSAVFSGRKPLYWSGIFLFFFLDILMVARFYTLLGRPALLSASPPAVVKPLARLNEIAKGKRVFISGSGVFWADALYEINQVRGGRDEVAVNPIWYKGAYELREGADPPLTREWLTKLGVEYVLVNTPSSPEYYHDFKNLAKWGEIGARVWEGQGDIIYRVKKP